MGLQQSTTKTVAAITTERKGLTTFVHFVDRIDWLTDWFRSSPEQNLAAAKFGKAIDRELNVDLQLASQTARSPLNKVLPVR